MRERGKGTCPPPPQLGTDASSGLTCPPLCYSLSPLPFANALALEPKAFLQMTIFQTPGSRLPSCSIQLLLAWGRSGESAGPSSFSKFLLGGRERGWWCGEATGSLENQKAGKVRVCAATRQVGLWPGKRQGGGLRRTAGWDAKGRRGAGPGVG